MTALAWLVPVALFLGGLGLYAFLWSLKSGQYDDLEGAGWRALDDEQPVEGGRVDVTRSLAAGKLADKDTMVRQ
jgi:cbb3-type cytochrome oxidase maturation protein